MVAASERAARALTAAFHRARRAEGLTAWPAPPSSTGNPSFAPHGRTTPQPATPACSSIPSRSNPSGQTSPAPMQHMATLLEGPRNRMASLAMEAHKLLCSYAPQFLQESARAAWQQDAENFSAWLAAFDETCRTGNLLSPARLPLELIPLLEIDRQRPPAQRPPLLLAGFDRILPVQRRLFDAWGEWRQEPLPASLPRDPLLPGRRHPIRARRLRSLVQAPTCRQPAREPARHHPGPAHTPRRNRARIPQISQPRITRTLRLPALRVLSRHPARPGCARARSASPAPLAVSPTRRT